MVSTGRAQTNSGMYLCERMGSSAEEIDMDKSVDEQEAELRQTLADVKTDSQFYRAG